jgi:hypothetical protein
VSRKLPVCLLLVSILLLPIGTAPLLARATPGAEALQPIGVVTESTNTTSRDAPVQPGQNVFAGDSLNVANGGTWVLLSDGSEVMLGPMTQARFEQQAGRITALVQRGTVSLRGTTRLSDTEVRSGNVLTRLGQARAEAVVTATPAELIVAARTGSLKIETSTGTLAVNAGDAVRFLREMQDPQSGAQPPNPPNQPPASSGAGGASGAGASVPWGRLAVCAGAGATIGAIPVIVHKTSSSPDGQDWEYAFMPAGAAAGVLGCKAFFSSPPVGCTLKADRPEITEGDSVTLTWTSPKGYKDVLTDVGDEPSSGHVTLTPDTPGNRTYRLTAEGPAGTLVCMADVKVVPAKKDRPTCTITVTPAKVDKPGDEVSITWTLPPGTTKANLVPRRDLLNEKQPLKLKVQSSTTFQLYGDAPTGEFQCNAKVEVPENKCIITAKPIDETTVKLEWKIENGQKATLQEFFGGKPVDDPADLAPGDIPAGSKEVAPDGTTRYVLTVTGGDRPPGKCEVVVPVPGCTLRSKTLNKGEVQISYWYYGGVAKVSIAPDPNPKPRIPIYVDGAGSGKFNTKPGSDIAYEMTVTGGLGNKLVRRCEVAVEPTQCMLTAPANVDPKSKTFELKYNVENAKKATLTIRDPNADGKQVGKAQDVPPGEGKLEQETPKTSTEYVLSLEGPGNVKSECRACVLIKRGEGKTLPIPPSTQKEGMWCWLTVGEMVFQYYKVPNINPLGLYQCGIIGTLFPAMCGYDCTKCARMGGGFNRQEFITDMLKLYPQAAKSPPIASQKKEGRCPLTEKQIKDEIDAGRPVIAGISPGAGQFKNPPDHVALIIGYEMVDGKMMLRVNDPWPFKQEADPYRSNGALKDCNGSYSIPFEAFCNKFGWTVAWSDIKPAK